MAMEGNSEIMEDDNNQHIVDFETAHSVETADGKAETADVLFDGKDDDFSTMLMSKGTDLSGCLVGIKARKWEHIYSLYKKHSQLKGFSIKKSTSRRADVKDRPLIERYFRCSCAGVHGNGSKVSSCNVRNATITRCKCEAFVRTQVNNDGLWEVVQDVAEHNHPFTPVQWQHHHRSERKITEAEGEVIKAMTEAHVPPSVQFRVAAAGAGGDAFVGLTKRDHINYVNRLKMKSIEGGDAATLINLMTSRQAEEPGFFFRVQFDEKRRLSNLFWLDAIMREDYLLYGDVKIFDTTYRTNRYNLICGVFVGINNHWSNVMFGYAFLSNEREESFEWLFNVFNEAMGEDVRPVSIFTDQDQAIANAIETVYTLEMFQVFEKEFALVMGTRAVILPIDDPEVLLYRVSPGSHDEDDHHVTYDCKNNLTECTCRNFQVKGMLCSHIIRVLHMHSVVEIPDRAVVDKLFIKANEKVELLLSKLNMEEDQPTVDVSVPPILDPVRCTTKGSKSTKKRNMGTRKKARKGSDVGAGESTMYVAMPRPI
ncbi:protein FAR1-RELATED SEQUENCE 5-like [Silene latifolia]|uniref:protein FAR1-RELATED SEQUENCE 5-like n=1 Tax=Silene latifolia TaxID=37657 RepID=UPI003D783E11